MPIFLLSHRLEKSNDFSSSFENRVCVRNSNPCDFFLCYFDKFSESADQHGEWVLYLFHLLGIQFF